MRDAPNEPDDLALPPRLADELAHVYRAGPDVPAGVDSAILTAARGRLLRRRRHVRHAALGAVAAGVAILVGVAVWTTREPSPAAQGPAVVARPLEDVN